MTYQIAYGADTASIEDPDQIVLLTLPDECAEMDTDDLTEFINENWGSPDVSAEPMVGFGDVVESLHLLMAAEGIAPEVAMKILAGLADALDNNA